jgi:phosphoglycerate dehydrogenase-like enzyme
VNVARGTLIDEAALVDALRAGRLAGAALDAVAAEPLAADSPLWDLPNVLITPHQAPLTDRFADHLTDFWVDNIRRFAAGQPLRGVVDRQARY